MIKMRIFNGFLSGRNFAQQTTRTDHPNTFILTSFLPLTYIHVISCVTSTTLDVYIRPEIKDFYQDAETYFFLMYG